MTLKYSFFLWLRKLQPRKEYEIKIKVEFILLLQSSSGYILSVGLSISNFNLNNILPLTTPSFTIPLPLVDSFSLSLSGINFVV
jgi:hypothetical protein